MILKKKKKSIKGSLCSTKKRDRLSEFPILVEDCLIKWIPTLHVKRDTHGTINGPLIKEKFKFYAATLNIVLHYLPKAVCLCRSVQKLVYKIMKTLLN